MARLPFESSLVGNEPFAQATVGPGGSSQWWVLHTKPRTEKALARRLHQKGRSFFLPLYPRRGLSRGRVVTAHVPIFPGYLFLYGTDECRLEALKTNLVVNCLDVVDQAALDADLRQIHQALANGSELTPEARIEPGAIVRITQGPMRGMDGKVIRRGNQLRFLVEVRLLQRGVSVEVESWMITSS